MYHPPAVPPRSWPRIARLSLALLLAGCGSAAAQTRTTPLGALACLIQPSQVAEVGSAVIGVVERLTVDRGDVVRRGQVLAMLRSDVERASAEAQHSRAHSEGELRGALAAQELAQIRRDRAHKLMQENFVSQQALDQAEAELRVARERVTQVREALRTARREAGASNAQLAQRTLRAPFDGIVVERYANLGERFEDKALFRIAAISTLRVEVVAPLPLFGQLKVGQEIQVHPELPGAPARSARIAQIDQVLDPASNTFRLRLDLPNADGALPAGLRCRVDLGQATAPEATPGGARAPGRAAPVVSPVAIDAASVR